MQVSLTLLMSPVVIGFYTWRNLEVFTPAPLVCFLFFLVFALANRALIARVAPQVYRVESYEGDFRCEQFVLLEIRILRVHAICLSSLDFYVLNFCLI